jgi:Fe-S-cluster containining protein
MSAWYRAGLRFRCTQCAHCCTGPQGYVWLSPKDQESIASHLGLALEVFRKRYVRLVGQLFCLVDKPGGDCIFLTEDKRCAIHAAKPRQCLTFPFWPRLVESPGSWAEVEEACPGVGTGPLYHPKEIERALDRDTPKEELWKLLSKP